MKYTGLNTKKLSLTKITFKTILPNIFNVFSCNYFILKFWPKRRKTPDGKYAKPKDLRQLDSCCTFTLYVSCYMFFIHFSDYEFQNLTL